MLTVELESSALQTSGIDLTLVDILTLSGHDKISQPFELKARLVYNSTTPLDAADLMYAPVSFAFKRNGAPVRKVHGLIAGLRDHFNDPGRQNYIVYDIVVVPQMWNLSTVVSYEVHVPGTTTSAGRVLTNTIPNIIRRKLDEVGLVDGTDYVFNLSDESIYAEREFVLQYGETDLDFVKRLAEHWGITFYFDQRGTSEKIVFTDYPNGHHALERQGDLLYVDDGTEHDVYDLSLDHNWAPEFYCCVDYNYRLPTINLRSTTTLSSGAPGGVIDYGSHYYTTAEGAHLATVRSQEMEATREIYQGRTDLQQLAAGHMCTIGPHGNRTLPNLLVTEVHYDIRQPGGPMMSGDISKEIRFHAVDLDKGFRPRRLTPKPRIDGVLPAVIQHDDSVYMDNFPAVDVNGCYLIKFKFDAASTSTQDGSHRVRMAQTMAGEHYGWHFPVRKGVEVMVAFEGGDPDRPVIVGAVHHPTCPNPVVGTTQSKNRIKTESGIMIELEDGAGSGLSRRLP
jgi:type VI secretion system secreted protein VgrG